MEDDDDRDNGYENGDDNGDNGDNGDCEPGTPLEQVHRAQKTAAELEDQLYVLEESLSPSDAPPSPLVTFLRQLETSTGLKNAWLTNPDAVINGANLPPEDKAALRTGGIDAVNARLAAEGASNYVTWVRIWVRP